MQTMGIIFPARSVPVKNHTTPGMFAAALLSMLLILAWMGAVQDGDMRHSRKNYVGGEFRRAMQKLGIFAALNRSSQSSWCSHRAPP
jgi:hypothetical protein